MFLLRKLTQKRNSISEGRNSKWTILSHKHRQLKHAISSFFMLMEVSVDNRLILDFEQDYDKS